MLEAPPTIVVEPESPPIELDGEYRALKALARLVARSFPTPLDELEEIAHMARDLTHARYAAMGVTDENDKMEGFVTSGIEERRGLKTPPQGHGILGSLRQDGRPVRIDDIEKHPEGFGFPPQHPEMKSLLGVPLWGFGKLRGSLYVTDRDGGDPFTDHDEAVLLTLTRRVTYVIEHGWH